MKLQFNQETEMRLIRVWFLILPIKGKVFIMSAKIREYRGDEIIVLFDAKRCIHAAECIKGMPDVFNVKERPWIQPEGVDNDALVAVIESCPSGALQYLRSDGGEAEVAPLTNTIAAQKNGPLYVQGDLVITTEDGEKLHETRVALCRCGASKNKPFCDNSHRKIDRSL